MRELPESQFDLATFSGRVKHAAFTYSDPRTLFIGAQGLQDARIILEDYKREKIELSKKVWRAKKIIDASIHPDTQEKIFLPFRMSSFVFVNIIVTAGMLQAHTLPATIAWQVSNQTLNVAVNLANSNKSKPISQSQMLTAFCTAVVASCGVAVGSQKLVSRANLAPATKLLASRLVPFFAVASAGILNVFLMRGNELLNGIDVVDNEGNVKGQSKKAAAIAVTETAVSRVLNAMPIMVLPAIGMIQLQRRGLAKKWQTPANIAMILATSICALPFALGAFPQRQHVPGSRLEQKFHKEPMLTFNRGI